MEGIGLAPTMPLDLAFLCTAEVSEQLEGRTPFLALHLPIQHDRCGYHNQVGSPISPVYTKGGVTKCFL